MNQTLELNFKVLKHELERFSVEQEQEIHSNSEPKLSIESN